MCAARLPVLIDPVHFAETARIVEGELAWDNLWRLREAVQSLQSGITVGLWFGIDLQGIRFLAGRAVCGVELICQRCMQPMDWLIETHFRLGLITDEAAAEKLPGEYEPLLIGKHQLHLPEMIEDELLLALPIIPRHTEDKCPMKLTDLYAARKDVEEHTASNPFAVLAHLRKRH